jgi:hypothetical protein
VYIRSSESPVSKSRISRYMWIRIASLLLATWFMVQEFRNRHLSTAVQPSTIACKSDMALVCFCLQSPHFQKYYLLQTVICFKSLLSWSWYANIRLGKLILMDMADSNTLKKKKMWPQSESELYRPWDRRLSVKLVLTFADRGVPRGQRDGSLRPYTRVSWPEYFVNNPNKIADEIILIH